MKVTRQQARAQARIAQAMAEVGFALPGSLTVRAYKCGKPNCRCRADPPQLHGPYALWTRKIDNKTVTRRLTDDELTAFEPFFDNAKKLRALMAELQELTLRLLEQNDRSAQSGRAAKSATSAKGRTPNNAPNGRRPRQGV
ncbi:MAG: hypothetical protein LC749_03305 [Actinobacteria bacterium]|nr:hypothetical protein [Actinomycetota bacterium]